MSLEEAGVRKETQASTRRTCKLYADSVGLAGIQTEDTSAARQ